MKKAPPDENVRKAEFYWTGNLVGYDWSKQSEGQAYLGHIEARRPDLLGKGRDLVDQIRPRVEAINKDLAERYGWIGLDKEKETRETVGAAAFNAQRGAARMWIGRDRWEYSHIARACCAFVAFIALAAAAAL